MEEMRKQRKLVLANGAEFMGTGFGSANDALCELVFNTSMVGYQEVLTDPANAGRMVLLTYPLIGNYGINDEDSETRSVTVSAVIVREYCDTPSNFRYTKTLAQLLEENGVPGLEGPDTRELCRMLRDEGAQRALLCDADVTREEALKRIRAWEEPHDLVRRASCAKKWYARTSNPRYSVVAIDTGVCRSLLRSLNQLSCNVTVVPYDTSDETILAFKPDGVVLPSGAGNPADAEKTVATVRSLMGKLPMLGVGMGCQLLALSRGAKTYRMKFGHNGGNQPVRDVTTGAMRITSQSHLYAIDEASLEGTGLTVTHRNLMDGTVEGIRGERCIGVQYQAELTAFVAMMEEEKQHA